MSFGNGKPTVIHYVILMMQILKASDDMDSRNSKNQHTASKENQKRLGKLHFLGKNHPDCHHKDSQYNESCQYAKMLRKELIT